MTQAEHKKILDHKLALELKINCEYMPLQKQMDKALANGDLQQYMILESKIVPVRKQVVDGYNELLRLRNELVKKPDNK